VVNTDHCVCDETVANTGFDSQILAGSICCVAFDSDMSILKVWCIATVTVVTELHDV